MMTLEQDLKYTLKSERSHNPLAQRKGPLGFGEIFSDHMLLCDYEHGSWKNPRIEPYENFSLSPSTSVLHYGQGIFEGLKAYRSNQGVFLFREKDHFARMNRSASRMMMPTLDIDQVADYLRILCEVDAGWIPEESGASLYIRPAMIGMDPFLGVKPSKTYLFFIMTGPVGAYYPTGLKPVSLEVSLDYVRAAPGGTGEAKTMGNYAGSLAASAAAQKKGYTQVLWLDALERRYIEEAGVMNFFVKIDGVLITPSLTGTILPGITRDSVIKLARFYNIPVEERRITLAEIIDGIAQGRVEEAFGTGTAAVVSIINKIGIQGVDYEVPCPEESLGKFFYRSLTDYHYGFSEDVFGWRTQILS